MRILIVRNAKASTNAGIMRVVDALLDKNHDIIISSRIRDYNKHEKKIIKKLQAYLVNPLIV